MESRNIFCHRLCLVRLRSIDAFECDFKKNGIFSKIKIFLIFLIICISGGCEKFIDIPAPSTSVTGQSAYNSDVTAIAVLNGIYTRISNEQPNEMSISQISTWIAGLYADEYSLWSGVTNFNQLSYYKNDLSPVLGTGSEIWNAAYSYIYSCNAAIEGLEKSLNVSTNVKAQLLGEAKFMRAFFYFYLVNLYGDVPLVLSTDYSTNNNLSRAPEPEIYIQIIRDLKDCESLLNDDFLDASLTKKTTERVRPTKSAAYALLSRVYLYHKDWMSAEQYATSVINNNSIFGLESLNNSFKKNTKESIWQLQPTITGYNTLQGRILTIPLSGLNATNAFYLSQSLVKSFELGDERRTKWIDSVTIQSNIYRYPSKYKIGGTYNDKITTITSLSEYFTVLRLSEQFLIRAEARMQQNNIAGAIDDINMIRTRARAQPTVAIPNPLPDLKKNLSQSQCLSAIVQERRIELFSEWGHRWFDIKRLNMTDSIMAVETSRKGGVWQSYKYLFPIPREEINRNSGLKQNDGY